MNRRDVTLLMLALTDNGGGYTPVQIQKALFLLSREAPKLFDRNSKFDFKPYDYGPFDREVYVEIDNLAKDRLAETYFDSTGGFKMYYASDSGREAAQKLMKAAGPHLDYMRRVSAFVRRLSFADLVTSIYKTYPEMKANSIFVGG